MHYVLLVILVAVSPRGIAMQEFGNKAVCQLAAEIVSNNTTGAVIRCLPKD